MSDRHVQTLAALLHDEMRYRIGIPDPHREDLSVDEPTCQLLAAHLIASGVSLALPVPALDALREAAQEVVRLGNQPGLDDDEWEAAFTALEAALRIVAAREAEAILADGSVFLAGEAALPVPALDTLRLALQKISIRHSEDPAGGMGWRSDAEGRYGHYDHACLICGTSDEYAVEWPCYTRRIADEALAAALRERETTHD